ncbi:MAG: hypothetical protein B7Y31_04650 [Novosphingobium sp. 16-62-11]|uniref:hypothetical protein n=1 Tax=Novosphingobium sp. 17-62-19 TaxID=1970406 RepID=UPI000BD7B658|nr:hypothetical protein [Novosphingobium sp. 17-62-19]OYX91721.1 MAG: hypothetical protein B7Y74_13835 [Novosphingobium sp. 35-62-5]OYZ42959.1 MAG: hypothetical protein B7Y31_04650 [Novosphingobium sp. 16-62-11]OZA17721.1 MAG: hypothetical protein B7X90_14030 [Novosphingobium sp. 17-62-19]HQS96815.1 hypothetical protein [Novosphingobium sp.]
MSRAMNLNLPEATVRSRCEAAGVSISALEVLPSGGSRLVCTREEGADEMRIKLRTSIIDGKVARFAFQRAQNSQYN